MSGSKSKFRKIVLIVLVVLAIIVSWRVVHILPEYLERKELKEQARDALGESTLANLSARAEIYAFNKFEASYEGWCSVVESESLGLINIDCIDSKNAWALSARTVGTNVLKCVDSENGVVVGAISAESGLCEQGDVQVVAASFDSDANQITTQSNLSVEQIEEITNESIIQIRNIANQHTGIELQTVTVMTDLQSRENNEWHDTTIKPTGDYPVILVSGIANSRADLAKDFLGDLSAVPNFNPVLPTGVLTQASDIKFDMAVIVTGK